MSLLREVLQKRIDTPPPLYLEDILSEQHELYLTHVYKEAFHCASLAPSHGNTQPVRFAYFERMVEIIDFFNWLDENYSKEFNSEKYRSLVEFYGEKVKRLFIPIYKISDRESDKKSNPEWESQATAAMSVNNACISINQFDPFVQNKIQLFPSIHWWSDIKVLPYTVEYLYSKGCIDRSVDYGSLGILLGGFISGDTKEKFLNNPKHTEKLSLEEFVLKI